MKKRTSAKLSKSLADDVIVYAAAQIRAAYWCARVTHEGEYRTLAKVRSREDQYADSWRACAVYMLCNNFYPAACVEAKVRETRGQTWAVRPNQLYLQRDAAYYAEVCREHVEDIRQQFNTSKAILLNYCVSFASGLGMSTKETQTYCLLNEGLELTPLFRYCMAHATSDDLVQKKYATRAFCEYVCTRTAYDQVWKDLVPSEFKAQADEVINILASRSNRKRTRNIQK